MPWADVLSPRAWRGRYRGAFLRAVAARKELLIEAVRLENIPRLTPGEAIAPYFTLTWLMPQRRKAASLHTVRSTTSRESGKAVSWEGMATTFPALQDPDRYSLKIQVFCGRGASDFVSEAAWPLPLLADHVEPGPSAGKWTATLHVQHADHIKLAKRHRLPTLATLRFA